MPNMQRRTRITCYGTYTDTRNGKTRVRNECKVCRVKREAERWKDEEVKARHREHSKTYTDKNKDKTRKYARERHAIKRIEDPQFRLRANLGSSIRHALVGYKNDTCNVLIGCDVKSLKVWIEHQFTDGLTWNNCKDWHIDHVIPLAFFDLTRRSEQLLACNWSNLRPLTAHENLSKRDKIQKKVILYHIQIVKRFISLNSGYQADMETCWWQRLELWYGKNPDHEDDFTKFLQKIIRSEDPNKQGNVQRLNYSGVLKYLKI